LLYELGPRGRSNQIEVLDVGTGVSTVKPFPDLVGAAIATVGNKVLFAGGPVPDELLGVGGSDAVNTYDASTGQWSTAKLSQPRAYVATAVVGHKVLFAGGVSYSSPGGASAPLDTVDIYDADANTWSVARLSVPRLGTEAAVVGDQVIFAGGYDYVHGPSRAVDIYNASTGQWSTSKLPRGGLTVNVSNVPINVTPTVVGTKALFGDQNSVKIYDTATGQWSQKNLSQFRDHYAMVTVGNKVLFAGGTLNTPDPISRQNVATDVVDVFDAATDAWSVTHLPRPTSAPRGVVVGNQAMFVDDRRLAAVYDGTSGRWSTVTLDVTGGVIVDAVGSKVVVAATQMIGSAHNVPQGADVLSAPTVPPPSDPSPAQGATLHRHVVTFSWAPVPGANQYDLFIDGVLSAATVNPGQHSITDYPFSTGPHDWSVVALLNGVERSGPLWHFNGPSPHVKMQSANTTLPQTITSPDAAGTITVRVTNNGHAATLVQTYVEVFLSSDDVLDPGDRSAGYAFIDPVPAETSIDVPIDVSLRRLTPGKTYHLLARVPVTRRTVSVADLGTVQFVNLSTSKRDTHAASFG
jgi:N-acetylneuraminic acid mutarotase